MGLQLKSHILESRKLEQLKKVVHALKRKVLSLEDELKVLKNKKETDQEDNKENCFRKENAFNHEYIKSSTPKEVKDKVKDKCKDDIINCKECSYKCKREATLKKHMTTNHSHHTCKECKESLPSVMELLKHISKHHSKEQSDTNDKSFKEDLSIQKENEEEDPQQSSEEDALVDDLLLKDIEDGYEKYETNSSFDFST